MTSDRNNPAGSSWRLLAALSAIIFISMTLMALLPASPGAQIALAANSAPASSTKMSGSAAVGLPMPLAGIGVQTLIGRIIKYFLGLSGVIALLMFVFGGLSWMMAAGNQEKITKAKNTVVWAVIGLALTLGSYALAQFVMYFIFRVI